MQLVKSLTDDHPFLKRVKKSLRLLRIFNHFGVILYKSSPRYKVIQLCFVKIRAIRLRPQRKFCPFFGAIVKLRKATDISFVMSVRLGQHGLGQHGSQ
jgi:hypothetical protein